jgi:hypothetical protein
MSLMPCQTHIKRISLLVTQTMFKDSFCKPQILGANYNSYDDSLLCLIYRGFFYSISIIFHYNILILGRVWESYELKLFYIYLKEVETMEKSVKRNIGGKGPPKRSKIYYCFQISTISF